MWHYFSISDRISYKDVGLAKTLTIRSCLIFMFGSMISFLEYAENSLVHFHFHFQVRNLS